MNADVTADGGGLPAVARGDRAVPGVAASGAGWRPVVTLGEGATPLLPAPVLSQRTGCEVYLKVEGVNPTGSFKDRGMTMAVSMAVEPRRHRGDLRLHRQHQRERRRLRGPGRDDLRRARAPGQDRPGQAGPGPGARGPAAPGRRQLRRLPRAGPQAGRQLPGRAGQLGQPRPARRPEDRGVRDRRRAGRRARRALPAGRQRRQHHRLLEGLQAVRRGRPGHPDPADARLPGQRRGADRPGRAGARPGDHRHRDPDRQPGVVGAGRGGPR